MTIRDRTRRGAPKILAKRQPGRPALRGMLIYESPGEIEEPDAPPRPPGCFACGRGIPKGEAFAELDQYDGPDPSSICERCLLWAVARVGQANHPDDGPWDLELLKTERSELLDMTTRLSEHPDGYEGPCFCQLCTSYEGEPERS